MSANNKDLPLKSVWIQSSNFKILNISETGEGGGEQEFTQTTKINQ